MPCSIPRSRSGIDTFSAERSDKGQVGGVLTRTTALSAIPSIDPVKVADWVNALAQDRRQARGIAWTTSAPRVRSPVAREGKEGLKTNNADTESEMLSRPLTSRTAYGPGTATTMSNQVPKPSRSPKDFVPRPAGYRRRSKWTSTSPTIP